MQFLNWTSALLAAGLTVPPLVALYFLKLKRREVPIPSTLLWKRAVEDLQVNSPFQRLKNNLLLWLQILVLLLALLALSRPIMSTTRRSDRSIVLMMDQSSSMNVIEADEKTRFQRAQEQAKLAIDDMNENDRAMIIAFSDRARMVSAFTPDKTKLKSLIDGLTGSEGPSQLGEAIQLAEAYLQPQIIGGSQSGSDVTPDQTQPDAHLILFSDGRIDDADKLVLRRATMEIVNVAQTSDNVGIVNLDVRRNYQRPEILTVIARVQNFSDRAVETDVSLVIEQAVKDVQEVNLASGVAASTDEKGSLSAEKPPTSAPTQVSVPPASVAFVVFDNVRFDGGGPVEVRLSRRDALPADNRAYAVVQPPRHVSALLVTRGNYFLEKVLKSITTTHEIVTPEQYENMEEDQLSQEGRLKYDVVIFDDHSTDRLPRGNYFFIGGLPEVDGFAAGELAEGEQIIDWDDAHPILRNVNLENVYIFATRPLTLPPVARTIIEGTAGPVMSFVPYQGRQYLITNFSLVDKDGRLNTQWVLKWHFVVMVADALDYLTSSASGSAEDSFRPGQAVSVPVGEGVDRLKVTRPDGEVETIAATTGLSAHYANTRQMGLYKVQPAAAPFNLFAVNLFDENESRIGPHPGFAIGAAKIESAAGVQRVVKSIWPWLLAGALAFLLVEWIVYSRRVYV